MAMGMKVFFLVCLFGIIASLVIGFFGKHTPNEKFLTDEEKGKINKGGKKGGLFGKLKGGGGGGGAAGGGQIE